MATVRLTDQGLATATEEDTACSYAAQDKVWFDGPGGEPWEIYTVLANAEMPAGQLGAAVPGHATCCASRLDLTFASGAQSGSPGCC